MRPFYLEFPALWLLLFRGVSSLNIFQVNHAGSASSNYIKDALSHYIQLDCSAWCLFLKDAFGQSATGVNMAAATAKFLKSFRTIVIDVFPFFLSGAKHAWLTRMVDQAVRSSS